MKIWIEIGGLKIQAELNDSYTAKKIAEILPFSGNFSTWGDEIYFDIPVNCPLDHTAKETVELGTLGYWPTGNAFCIFFGPTPMSRGDEIIPASAVNIIGKITGDPLQFKSIMQERIVKLHLNA